MSELTEDLFGAIWREVTDGVPVSPQNKPHGVVLGGQPGAGKSNLIEKFAAKFGGNALVINGDEYRKFHPNYAELQRKFGKESVRHTAAFAGAVTEALLAEAIKRRLNIIIEGTFRTAHTPINTLKLLKAAGYQTTAAVITCDPALSYASCTERYQKMLAANPATARFTEKPHHDLVVKNLQSNCISVASSGAADEFLVYERKIGARGVKCELVHNSKVHGVKNLGAINKILRIRKNVEISR